MLGVFSLLFSQSISRLVQDHMLTPPSLTTPKLSAPCIKSITTSWKWESSIAATGSIRLFLTCILSTVLGSVLGILWMQRLIDADPRQKKIMNFTSVTDEVCTSKDSTVVNKDWEQFLLSGDEIRSLFQRNLQDLESCRGPLFRLLKSTLVHRPSLKCLCL